MSSTSQPEPSVIIRTWGGLGRLVLNRPKAINALDIEMVRAITAQLRAWIDDKDVSTVLIAGAGERGMCAGGDVRALHASLVDGHPEVAEQFFREEYAMNDLIATYPKPIVAVADGVTMGGGIGLAGHARIRLVTERSKLAMPETRIGFTPDVGGTWLLANAPGRLGEYLGLTGAVMGAADAVHAGFADRYVPSETLESLVEALERRADPGTPYELVLLFDETPEPGPMERGAAWIDDAFSRDTVADILARLDELAADEPDAAAAAATMREVSPSSLAVTLASIRAARRQPDLRAVLEQEFHLGAFLAQRPDMTEGIRAQLVDKTRDPAWSPATIAELPDGLGEEALAFRAPAPLWA